MNNINNGTGALCDGWPCGDVKSVHRMWKRFSANISLFHGKRASNRGWAACKTNRSIDGSHTTLSVRYRLRHVVRCLCLFRVSTWSGTGAVTVRENTGRTWRTTRARWSRSSTNRLDRGRVAGRGETDTGKNGSQQSACRMTRGVKPTK